MQVKSFKKKILVAMTISTIAGLTVLLAQQHPKQQNAPVSYTQIQKTNEDNAIVCNNIEETSELSMLLSNQDLKADPCLFIGCGGFF